MEKTEYQKYIKVLEEELIPALGCTEPIAIAYAAAKATEILGSKPEYIDVKCSGNIIKNVKGVIVPNSDGMVGVRAAALLGAVGGDASRGLEVLQSVTPEHIEKAKKMLEDKCCSYMFVKGVSNLYIKIRVTAASHYAEVELKDGHTNITRIEKDYKVLFEKNDDAGENHGTETDKSFLNIKSILEFANTANIADVKNILDTQIRLNSAIADEGLSGHYGAEVGRSLIEMHGADDVRIRARARAAAGSDARMNGCSFPVVINSGSGNQGMTVSLPVIEYAKEMKVPQEKLYRALLVSNLTAMHQKRFIGKLSAYCGAVSAACAAGVGIAYLHDASYEEICDTITDTLGNVSGIVCDGAKASCAAKISTAVDAAITGWYMSTKGRRFKPGEGIVKADIESTIQSVGRMGRVGMKSTDTEILKIMTEE